MSTFLFHPPGIAVKIIGKSVACYAHHWVTAYWGYWCSFTKTADHCGWQREVSNCCLPCLRWNWLLLCWLPKKWTDKVQQPLWSHAGAGKQDATRQFRCSNHLLFTWRNKQADDNQQGRWQHKVTNCKIK